MFRLKRKHCADAMPPTVAEVSTPPLAASSPPSSQTPTVNISGAKSVTAAAITVAIAFAAYVL